jgi:chromosomal replication initiation ATPase DnaA
MPRLQLVWGPCGHRARSAPGRAAPTPSSSKFVVGVAGVPGSGKSSLARAVVERLNRRGTPAVNVPMVCAQGGGRLPALGAPSPGAAQP